MPIKEGHGLTSVAGRSRIEELSNVEILAISLMLILTGDMEGLNSNTILLITDVNKLSMAVLPLRETTLP